MGKQYLRSTFHVFDIELPIGGWNFEDRFLIILQKKKKNEHYLPSKAECSLKDFLTLFSFWEERTEFFFNIPCQKEYKITICFFYVLKWTKENLCNNSKSPKKYKSNFKETLMCMNSKVSAVLVMSLLQICLWLDFCLFIIECQRKALIHALKENGNKHQLYCLHKKLLHF